MPTQTQTHSSTEYMYLATGTAPAPPLWECSTKHKASGAQADGGTDTKSDPFQNCIHCFRCGVSSPNTPSPLHPLPLSFSQVCVGAFTCTKHVRTNVCSSKCIMYVHRYSDGVVVVVEKMYGAIVNRLQMCIDMNFRCIIVVMDEIKHSPGLVHTPSRAVGHWWPCLQPDDTQ